MASIGKIARRTFLVGAAAIAGGVAVGYYFYRQPWPNPLETDVAEGEATFNPFVKIASDNTVTIIVPRAEMGQGVTTTLAAMVAEELDLELEAVTVEHGPASGAYFNTAMMEESGPFPQFDHSMVAETMRTVSAAIGKTLGLQVTGGSSSTRDAYEKMRHAGCAARFLLVAAAAKEWQVPAAELTTAGGKVTHSGSGRSATYGELAIAAAAIDPPSEITLRPKSEWKLLGKPQKRTDLLAKVTGAPIFGVDVGLPDMLYGTVRMNPRFWAKIKSADTSTAEKMPGVVKIVRLETQTGDGFGVIAQNTWAAFNAAEAIEVEWGDSDYPLDSAGISKKLQDALASPDGSSLRDDGDVDTEFADAPADNVLDVAYEVPYLAHACMEPMNATARLKDGVLDIWAPNQAPTIIQQVCGGVLGLESENVTVHTTYLGGGFGRRGEVDFSVYAALMAKETGGRPVKVTWSREEDTRHDTYRPAAAGHFRARIGADGMPEAVDMRIATPSVLQSVMRRTFPSLSPAGPERLLTEGAFDQPYTIANYRVTGVPADLSIPVGFWRSVGNSFNGFFHESFMDEIAGKGGVDPVELRRRLMADYPTAMKVVETVAGMSSWGESAGPDRAKGFAFTLSFGGWVGQVVQVAQTDDGIRIEKVWIAADIGEVLDPAIVEAQVISGAIYGLSSAMGQEITFADGAVEQSNFHDYDAMRINQAPEFEVTLLENAAQMGGAGEIGTPPSIPALANAVFALTGKRIRSMPLSKQVDFA